MAGMDDALKIQKTGITLTAGAASSSASIPTDSSGNAPRYIRVASLAACFVKVGKGATTAVANGDILVQPADSLVLNVAGMDTIACIQSGAGTTVQVSPVENC